jgi:hypothetical protein
MIFIYPDYPVDPVKKMEIPILSSYAGRRNQHSGTFPDLEKTPQDFSPDMPACRHDIHHRKPFNDKNLQGKCCNFIHLPGRQSEI